MLRIIRSSIIIVSIARFFLLFIAAARSALVLRLKSVLRVLRAAAGLESARVLFLKRFCQTAIGVARARARSRAVERSCGHARTYAREIRRVSGRNFLRQ